MLRNILKYILPDLLFRFSGGGGGGDDNADDIKRLETSREADMQVASRNINSLFGIDSPEVYAGLGPAPPNARLDANNVWHQKDGDTYVYEDPALAAQAVQNKLARESDYNKSHSDIMNFFTKGLDEQLQGSTQAQTYDLARKGLLKGSEDLQAEAGRTRRYDDALLGLTNEADTAINKLRTSDETARLNLLSSIRAGLDQQSAIAGATNSLTNNMNNATNAAHATQFSGVFDDLNNLYKAGVYTKGAQQGINNPYGSSYSPGTSGSSYSGSTFKY